MFIPTLNFIANYFSSSAVIGPSLKNEISIRGALNVLPCSAPTLAASASASASASSCCVSHKNYSCVYSVCVCERERSGNGSKRGERGGEGERGREVRHPG